MSGYYTLSGFAIQVKRLNLEIGLSGFGTRCYRVFEAEGKTMSGRLAFSMMKTILLIEAISKPLLNRRYIDKFWPIVFPGDIR